jgi:hypothetical protein
MMPRDPRDGWSARWNAKNIRRATAGRRDKPALNPDDCDHDFQGWRAFADGNGGEQVCARCGIGAMQWTLRTGF